MKHVAIVPAQNEQAYIARTLASLIAQTERPDRIVVVDDGSTDATADLVRGFMREHSWISLVQRRGDGTRSYRVVEVFAAGYATVRNEDFTYVSNLDADLVFPPDYFARLFRVMDADPTIAIASGTLYEVMAGGRLMRLRMPEDHVPGPLTTIRKAVFDAMGGFVPVLAWDIVDSVKIRLMGYRSVRMPDLAVQHLRRCGSATGILAGNLRMGHGAYEIGTHPVFAIARSIYRMFEPPYVAGGVALGYGYFKSWLVGAPQIHDRPLIEALRREQLFRLLHGNRNPGPVRPDRREVASSGDGRAA